jgi:hypothetical protein
MKPVANATAPEPLVNMSFEIDNTKVRNWYQKALVEELMRFDGGTENVRSRELVKKLTRYGILRKSAPDRFVAPPAAQPPSS